MARVKEVTLAVYHAHLVTFSKDDILCLHFSDCLIFFILILATEEHVVYCRWADAKGHSFARPIRDVGRKWGYAYTGEGVLHGECGAYGETGHVPHSGSGVAPMSSLSGVEL